MKIVLLGGPGAGKGTLAKQLHDEYEVFLLSPGELYRNEAAMGTEFGLKAKNEYWGSGYLCPDEMTNELVKNTVDTVLEKTSNIVFDGYPRTYDQAVFLDFIAQIDLVLDIHAHKDTVIKRLLRRASIENRPDDTEEIIKQRIKVYDKNNKRILEYYKSDANKLRDRYHAIDGDGSPLDTLSLAKKIVRL